MLYIYMYILYICYIYYIYNINIYIIYMCICCTKWMTKRWVSLFGEFQSCE